MIPKVSLPIQLLIVVGAVITAGHLLPTNIIQMFYTFSIIFKEFLGFLLPIMVFSFIAAGMLSFKHRAPLIITILLCCVFASNILIPLISYITCISIIDTITSSNIIEQLSTHNSLQPLLSLQLPRIMGPEHAILLAITTGIALSCFTLPRIESAIERLKQNIEWIINNIFIPILPFYIFGFLLEVHHRGVFLQLCQSYGKTYALIFILQILLIFAVYLLASGFHIQQTMTYIRNAMPSYLTAFGTMSSTAAIPVTIKCAHKNINNKPLTLIATPILANIHLYGDAITIPILAVMTVYLFTGTIPTIATFFTFIIYFCLTMLAAAGIPGGGVIVCIPILKSILGFTDPMISIIITLHLLQDGFGTGSNVMGDGALMIIINNLLKRIKIY